MIQNIFRRLRNFFRKLKFRYKLSIYFTLFGLLIGYASFIMFMAIVTFKFVHIGMDFVNRWRTETVLPGDFIMGLTDKKFSTAVNSVSPAIGRLTMGFSRDPYVKDIYFYCYNPGEKLWYRIYRDSDDVMKIGEIPENSETSDAWKTLKRTIYLNSSIFYGRSDELNFWLNITRPSDRNFYFMRIVSVRSGILDFLEGGHIVLLYAAGVLFISLLLSRLISLHISRPIGRLSSQAVGIASGMLELRTSVHSKDEIGALSSSLNFMAEEIGKYVNDIKIRMEAISLMNRIDKAVLSSLSRKDLIDSVTSIVSELFSDSYVSLAMVDKPYSRYHLLSHYIMGRRTMPEEEYYFSFEKFSPAILERNKEFYILDYDADREIIEWVNGIINQNYRHVMNLPIYMDEEYTASLIIGKASDTPFTDFEKDTSKALADQTGVAMKSVRYVEERENLYLGILLALARTIDAKSKWTAGHSERVAVYSEKIALSLGMDQEFIADLKVSASLHDIGKIGVPESILDKEGPLSDEEFDLIKKHPKGGADIIEAIPGYEKFLNGIIFHHEFWDGSGYPFGLKGAEIPLMGRIIAVADVYDSLVSDRPYRKGMNCEKAVEILEYEKERKLDPEIVDIITEIIRKG